MYMVLTLNPLYGSKNFFDSIDSAYDHIYKVIDLSLEFFRKMRLEEASKYNVSRLQTMHELVKLVHFDDRMRKLFGKAAPLTKPITNEEYARICNTKNKARHLGKDDEEINRKLGKI